MDSKTDVTIKDYYSPMGYKLLRDCQLMADYALDCGKNIPQHVSKTLAEIDLITAELKKEMADVEEKITTPPENKKEKKNREEIIKQLNDELDKYKVKISEKIKNKFNDLAKIYLVLRKIVEPANPLSIEFTLPRVSFWGSRKGAKTIPLIRNMWWASLIFLLAFILTNILNGIYPSLIVSHLNILIAAGLGAYFYSLYSANKYVVARTFNPPYVTFYYNRIFIGIISGYILANIINIDFLNKNPDGILAPFGPSIIALLGGFSTNAVVKILNRIVAMLITFVEGDTKSILDSRAAELKAKFGSEFARLKLNTALDLTAALKDVKESADAKTYKKINDLVDKLVEESINIE